MKCIKEDRAAYLAQWVVVDGDSLIAADADGHNAFAAAKATGIDVPLLVPGLAEEALRFVPCWSMSVSIKFAESWDYASADGIEI